MPRDTWRNSRKPKEFIGDDTSVPYETEKERTAYYKNNAERIRREHKEYLAFLKEQRDAEKYKKEKRRKKMIASEKRNIERKRLKKLNQPPKKK